MDITIASKEFYDYSSYIKGYSKATIKRYKYVIEFYCKISRISDLSEVTQENVRAMFYYGRTNRNWTPSTFIVFHKSLLVFFRWCVSRNYMVSNPVIGIEKPRVEYQLPKKLTKQDSIRFLEIIYNYPFQNKFLRERNHAIFSTFLLAGLRRKELLTLRYVDVDIENSVLFVRQGKGGKDRVIPMNHSLVEILKGYFEERKRLKKTCPEFFASLQNNRGFSGDGLKHLVKMVREITGIEFSVHKLRHTFATLMLEGGCDIYSLSKMMGHSNINTTTIYLAASVEHLRSQITKHPLNEVLR